MTPSIQLSQKEKNAITCLVEQWIPRMNFNNACLHFELKCRPESIYHKSNFDQNDNLIDANDFLMPIEINMRLGGAETWSMTRNSYGIDLLRAYVDIRLGFPCDTSYFQRKAKQLKFRCISKDIHPARNVMIKSLKIDLKQIRALDCGTEIYLARSTGDKLTVMDYIGWVCVRSSITASMSELERNLQRVMSCIQLELVDY